MILFADCISQYLETRLLTFLDIYFLIIVKPNSSDLCKLLMIHTKVIVRALNVTSVNHMHFSVFLLL